MVCNMVPVHLKLHFNLKTSEYRIHWYSNTEIISDAIFTGNVYQKNTMYSS